MRSFVVFSAMGPDRPGLAREIAEFFTARGINIERFRGCVLGGEFGMIILSSGKTEDIDRLMEDLGELRQRTNLEIHVRKTKAPAHHETKPGIPYRLTATALDRPGIIHQICRVLQDRGINIDDISTNVDHNFLTGAAVFQMVCSFCLPPGVKVVELKRELTRVGDEFNIDIRFEAVTF